MRRLAIVSDSRSPGCGMHVAVSALLRTTAVSPSLSLALSGCLGNLSRAANDQVRAQVALGLISGSVDDSADGVGPIVVAALETESVVRMKALSG